MKKYLQDIIDAKKKTVDKILISEGSNVKKERKSFIKILETKSAPVIIAEIKKASPSRGIIRADFNFEDIFSVYEQNKFVDAVSVLTEENFFLGHLDFVKSAVKGKKPVLRKDFIFSEKQVYETAEAGADIMLLIAAILSEPEYKNLYNLGKTLNLEIITEIHNFKEYRMVSKYKPEIIGVNNRNLDTFEVSLEVSESIIKGKITDAYYISESGIKNSEDIRKLYGIGFKGFLIGESIMKNTDINSALNGLQI